MKDILLWHTLLQCAAGERPPPEALRPLLEDLSTISAAERVAFFGLLPGALEHPQSDVRAAAVAAMGGASGYLGLRHLVKTLDDADAAVRAAAVEALSKSTAGDAPRFVHALFHADPAVRLAALGAHGDRDPRWYNLLLLADAHDDCRKRVLDDPPPTVPAAMLFTLLEFLARGLLPPESGRAYVAKMPVDAVAATVDTMGRRRGPTQAAALAGAASQADHAAARGAVDADPSRDTFDELFGLFWDDEKEGDAPRQFYQRVTGWLVHHHARESLRVACALFQTAAARRGAWHPLGAELCVLAFPEFVRLSWVAKDVRRQSIRALYQLGAKVPHLPPKRVKELLESDVCRRDNGSLDLWAVGGVLHLADPKKTYELVRECFGVAAVTAAFLEDPEDSAPFLCLAEDAHKGRQKFITEIARRGGKGEGSVLAVMVHVSPSDRLDFLDDVYAEQALGLFDALVAMGARHGRPLSDIKVRRLTEVLAPRLGGDLGPFLQHALRHAAPQDSELAVRMLTAMARGAKAEEFVEAAMHLDALRLKKLLSMIPCAAGFPYGCESALAHWLLARANRPPPGKTVDPEIRDWAAARATTAAGETERTPQAASNVRALAREVVRDIAACSPPELADKFAPCLTGPSTGLCDALARRPRPTILSLAACVALMGCHDPVDAVAEQFARHSSDDPKFLKKLDRKVADQWSFKENLPLLANAWLHAWDPHCLALGDATLAAPGGFVALLGLAQRLPSPVLCRQLFEAVARLFAMWRWRDRTRLAAAFTPELAEVLVSRLTSGMTLEHAVPSANALASAYESGVAAELLAALKPRVLDLLPDMAEPVRRALSAWVDSSGLSVARVARVAAPPPDPAVIARIRRSDDPAELEPYCRSDNDQVVQEATLRLIEIGEDGVRRLVPLFLGPDAPPLVMVIAGALALWPEGAALDDVRAMVAAGRGEPELLFTLALGLMERGERGAAASAFAAACREAPASWFRRDHWDRLLKLAAPLDVVALDVAAGLSTSPHAHAYRPAVEMLLSVRSPTPADVEALRAFLLTDSGRWAPLRVGAARWLQRRGDFTGFPILLQYGFKPPADATVSTNPSPFAGAPPELVDAAVTACLVAGHPAADEANLLEMLDGDRVDPVARGDAHERLLKDAALDRTRAAVVGRVRTSAARSHKLRRVAEAFAWGVVTGRELTGRIFTVEMNSGEGLGHTRFNADKVWVSALPILRGERNADDVVEGLIIHEFGHHVYHRSPEAQAVWNDAQKRGFHGLLNLVSDEHLERNLRAADEAFGDRLKRLAAYAFQHADKEVPVDSLLASLQARSLEVLSRSRLHVARKRGCVGVQNGAVLLEMERAGMSFARFVRALRMGLGNRHNDPKVEQALALFRGRAFRSSAMPDLMRVSERLREIFGWEVVLMEHLHQGAVLVPGPGEMLSHGEGITNAEVQDVVQRILAPPSKTRRTAGGGTGPPIRQINVGPDEHFEPITTVVPVPFDPAKHAAYARQVARHARQMRRYFEELGLRLEPQRYRVQGRAFDRTRIEAGLIRGDPRVLIARQVAVRTDLFLGLVIDCSGSMAISSRIEQAKLFGTLLAEAAKGLSGIDVRVYGFTDSVIYDAGDAGRCAAHSLVSEGGNNDAAALWHAAQAALASRRKAKLLVMISDGSPTECSVAALRGLVSRLTHRMKMCCAQVAVAPIEEVCFPNYVLLNETDLSASVRKFGAVAARLVRKAVRG